MKYLSKNTLNRAMSLILVVILLGFLADSIHADEDTESDENRTGISVNTDRLNQGENTQGIKDQERVFTPELQKSIEVNREIIQKKIESNVNHIFQGDDIKRENSHIFSSLDTNEYKKQEVRLEKNDSSFIIYALGFGGITMSGFVLFRLIGGEEDGN